MIDRLALDIPDTVLWPILAVCGVGLTACLILLISPASSNRRATMQRSTGDQSPNIESEGDVTIKDSFNVSEPKKALLPWYQRAGGPVFRLGPNIDNSTSGGGRLICGITISDASPTPGGVETRWIGAGTEMDWKSPMRDNTPPAATHLKFSMKPVEMNPTPPNDEVALEIRFNLEDGQHGGRWTWPLRQHPDKGHWVLDSHLGSNVRQPLPEDTW